MLFGDGTRTWGPDPELNTLGLSQIKVIEAERKRSLVTEHTDQPLLPSRLISKPYARSEVTIPTA